MVNVMVTMTSKKIQKTLDQLPEEILSSDKYTQLKLMDDIEMYAFIGLTYFRGLFGQNSRKVSSHFSDRGGHPAFSATMSRDGFNFILAHPSFDDEETHADCWEHDRFAAYHQMFEAFNGKCLKHLVPSDYLSLDETLYPMRMQISF